MVSKAQGHLSECRHGASVGFSSGLAELAGEAKLLRWWKYRSDNFLGGGHKGETDKLINKKIAITETILLVHFRTAIVIICLLSD